MSGRWEALNKRIRRQAKKNAAVKKRAKASRKKPTKAARPAPPKGWKYGELGDLIPDAKTRVRLRAERKKLLFDVEHELVEQASALAHAEIVQQEDARVFDDIDRVAGPSERLVRFLYLLLHDRLPAEYVARYVRESATVSVDGDVRELKAYARRLAEDLCGYEPRKAE